MAPLFLSQIQLGQDPCSMLSVREVIPPPPPRLPFYPHFLIPMLKMELMRNKGSQKHNKGDSILERREDAAEAKGFLPPPPPASGPAIHGLIILLVQDEDRSVSQRSLFGPAKAEWFALLLLSGVCLLFPTLPSKSSGTMAGTMDPMPHACRLLLGPTSWHWALPPSHPLTALL